MDTGGINVLVPTSGKCVPARHSGGTVEGADRHLCVWCTSHKSFPLTHPHSSTVTKMSTYSQWINYLHHSQESKCLTYASLCTYNHTDPTQFADNYVSSVYCKESTIYKEVSKMLYSGTLTYELLSIMGCRLVDFFSFALWVKIWVRSKFQIYHPYSGVRSKLRIYHPLSRHSKHLHLTHSSHDLTRAEWTTSTSPKQNKLVSQGTSVQKICFSVRDTNKMIHLCIYITYFADICY